MNAAPSVLRAALPEWFPEEERVVRALVRHQPFYRWRRPRYLVCLLRDLAVLLPQARCRVLDVGGGSGVVGQMVADFFPGKTVTAIDVADRFLPTLAIPHRTFDGRTIPFPDRSFDCALFSNVLHHVPRALRAPLLREALRVTGGACVVVKDHLADSAFDRARLAWLDLVGNLPFGGMLRAEYLGSTDWEALFEAVGCKALRLAVSAYRGGAGRLAFPNRLEVCFRLAPAARE